MTLIGFARGLSCYVELRDQHLVVRNPWRTRRVALDAVRAVGWDITWNSPNLIAGLLFVDDREQERRVKIVALPVSDIDVSTDWLGDRVGGLRPYRLSTISRRLVWLRTGLAERSEQPGDNRGER